MTTPQRQDSNLSSLRIAEEVSIGKVNGSAIWLPMEPNSYSEFGGKLKSVARKPIAGDRQRRKGSIVDIDTSAGFNQDWTMNNLTRILQGALWNNLSEKLTNNPFNGTVTTVSSVVGATKTFTFSAALPIAFDASAICFNSGFTNAGNNGVHAIASKTSTTVVFAGTGFVDETPPNTAKILTVGFQLGSGNSAIVLVTTPTGAGRVRLTDSVKDLRSYGLTVGEWVFIGGDATGTAFTNNVGFGRISAVAQGYLEFDKVSWSNPQAETGTGKTIQVFIATLLRNPNPTETQVRRTYQLERQVGTDTVGTMSEYVTGALLNEFTINVPEADKINVDLGFIGLGYEPYNGTTGIKAGNRPVVLNEDAVNTTSDVARINLTTVDSGGTPNVTPLFAHSTDVKLTLKNNATTDKCIGQMGGFDASVGQMELDGTLSCYFADMDSVIAVRNNADVTMDLIFLQPNQGIVVDIPLMQLGDGSLKIEANKAIMLPLSNAASMGLQGYTLLINKFDYLPALAGF